MPDDPFPNQIFAGTRRTALVGLFCAPLAVLSSRMQASIGIEEQKFVELHIATGGDELAFSPTHLSCPTRALVRLFFHHAGQIINDRHNWVLLKPGTRRAFLADADKEQDPSVNVPPNVAFMVISATELCGRGQTVVVDFVAPPPGEYPFVCSVAGHGETMNGTVTVTE